MTTIDLTTPNYSDLNGFSAVGLRKIAAQAGIKGANKGRKADLIEALVEIQAEQLMAKKAEQDALEAEREAELAAIEVESTPNKKGTCEDGCGRKVNKQIHPTICPVCYDYAGWENTHADETEHDADEHSGCPICHPELDKRFDRRAGVSRIGQVIVARGTEVHKAITFRLAAEAAGWTVVEQTQTYEGGNTRHYATATKGTESISLAWEGRRYDYPASSAVIAGKDRKVRNLKEALRFL